MFGLKRMVCALAMAALVGTAFQGEAQQQDRRQRRLNATRRARIAKTIEETYSHKYELFGGVGYLRFRSGEFLQRNNEVTWNVAGNYYLNPRWAVVADVRGHYGNAKTNNNPYNVWNPLITHYTFMGGPQYRFYRKERFSASVNALGGLAMGNFDGGSKGIPADALGMWKTSNTGAFSVGANLEYSFYPNLAFRIAPAYEATTFGSKLQNNMGFNMGVLYRWGVQGK
ncbi:porin family protein [Terriglobus tenax]|uniref:porin family protein n=1 Tax=Terriglobus tenax TaxID=1111115 RepID=UPI0021E0F58F|nr:porin family protein [Terriglobus tenax]